MKRFLLIISACAALMFATSSCRFIHETFYSVEGCTEWYLDEIYQAGKDVDFAKITELSQQYGEWFSKLSTEDQVRAGEASYKWIQNNPIAAAALESLGDMF